MYSFVLTADKTTKKTMNFQVSIGVIATSKLERFARKLLCVLQEGKKK